MSIDMLGELTPFQKTNDTRKSTNSARQKSLSGKTVCTLFVSLLT